MLNWPEPQVNRFFEATRIANFAISSDENKLIFTSNIKGEFDLWGMDLPNMYPYPLTFRGQTINSPTFSPDGTLIGFSSDIDGNEDYQIYLMSSSGGEVIRITNDDFARHVICQITRDGKIYYTSNQANPTYMNLFVYDLKTETHIRLFAEDVNCYCGQVFYEEGYLYYYKVYANTHIEAWLYNLETGEQIRLTPEDVPHISENVQFISKDELLYTTDLQSKYPYIMKYDLRTGTHSVFEQVNGGIGFLKVSSDKKWLSYVLHKGVEDYLYVRNLKTGQIVKVPTEMTIIHQTQFGPKTNNLYYWGSSAISTDNIHCYKLSTGEVFPVTNNPIPGVNPQTLVNPETVHYQSFDGLEIEALLFKAENNYNGHWIIWPHGGPQSASRKFYRGMFQYFLANGYSIFAPNFRGSSHYGSAFMKMVEREWGEGPRLDVVTGVEWLVRERHVSREKLFVVGGSYGGYMSLLLHGRNPELWKGVVDIFGPSNLLSFVKSVPPFWKPIMKQWLGDEVEDRERLIKDSPITYLDQMTKPMLIIQGANDPRVVRAESDQIVEQLSKKGVQVDYLVLDDEGHGFSRRNNEIEVAMRIVGFLNSLL